MKQYPPKTLKNVFCKVQSATKAFLLLLRTWISEEDHVMKRLEKQYAAEGDFACR